MPEITTIVALARRPVQLGAEATNTDKFKPVVIGDYEEYSETVKSKLLGADACIWTVAVTPFRHSNEASAGSPKPMVFVYLSVEGTSQDLSKKPFIFGVYQLMRGKTEILVQEYGAAHKEVDVHIVRPGMIWSPTTFWRSVQSNMFRVTNLVTRAILNISLEEVSAAVLY
ncbi:hypothetical protein B0H63DRAFT_516644 [Podospora didyma]|uniref:NAD(P)-binding domain-containing protein n=1 Tax=Podospora didyma TaxID=330526 RepID=A0AAE0P4R8_9PEZI|nr:hypothetical protein B0H63DRAFT_516644 [Podospora didyma]